MLNYLNNAGAGLMNDETINTMLDFYKYEQIVGAYQAAKDKKNEIDFFYKDVVKLINAETVDEIAFVDSASRGWNLALYGSCIGENDNIITLSSEFGTNLVTIYDFAQKVGANVNVVNCNEDGTFDVSIIEQLLKNMTGKTMMAISHVAAQGSIVNPVYEIGEIAQKFNTLYIVDGCQSIGQMNVDVQKMQCDAFVVSGRKWLCGPRGTGFMYVKKSADIKTTQLDLASADLVLNSEYNVIGVTVRNDAKKFELWERSIASVLGFSKAISIIQNIGMNTISESVSKKADIIRNAVVDNKKLKLLGQKESSSGIVGFYVVEPTFEEKVSKVLADRSLIISTMSDWDCPLYFPRNGAKCIFRLSPHYFTNNETLKIACDAISSI